MGRIEDMLIAIHLFGLDAVEREVVVGGRGWPGEGLWDASKLPVHGPKHLVRRLVVPGGPGDHVEVERYSTTWAGMGLVIEAMRERGYMAEITIYPDGTASARFRVFERRYYYSPSREDALAAPMAVVLAALAALGVEVRDDE